MIFLIFLSREMCNCFDLLPFNIKITGDSQHLCIYVYCLGHSLYSIIVYKIKTITYQSMLIVCLEEMLHSELNVLFQLTATIVTTSP